MANERRPAARTSAGILLYRRRAGRIEVLIGHMGGPWWARRDHAAWSIPKGEYGGGETAISAARREFREELGVPVPDGTLQELGTVRQPGGKLVTVWALEAEISLEALELGTFEMEWPKGSGTIKRFPELDRVGWFALPEAGVKLVAAQREFLDRLQGRPRRR